MDCPKGLRMGKGGVCEDPNDIITIKKSQGMIKPKGAFTKIPKKIPSMPSIPQQYIKPDNDGSTSTRTDCNPNPPGEWGWCVPNPENQTMGGNGEFCKWYDDPDCSNPDVPHHQRWCYNYDNRQACEECNSSYSGVGTASVDSCPFTANACMWVPLSESDCRKDRCPDYCTSFTGGRVMKSQCTEDSCDCEEYYEYDDCGAVEGAERMCTCNEIAGTCGCGSVIGASSYTGPMDQNVDAETLDINDNYPGPDDTYGCVSHLFCIAVNHPEYTAEQTPEIDCNSSAYCEWQGGTCVHVEGDCNECVLCEELIPGIPHDPNDPNCCEYLDQSQCIGTPSEYYPYACPGLCGYGTENRPWHWCYNPQQEGDCLFERDVIGRCCDPNGAPETQYYPGSLGWDDCGVCDGPGSDMSCGCFGLMHNDQGIECEDFGPAPDYGYGTLHRSYGNWGCVEEEYSLYTGHRDCKLHWEPVGFYLFIPIFFPFQTCRCRCKIGCPWVDDDGQSETFGQSFEPSMTGWVWSQHYMSWNCSDDTHCTSRCKEKCGSLECCIWNLDPNTGTGRIGNCSDTGNPCNDHSDCPGAWCQGGGF